MSNVNLIAAVYPDLDRAKEALDMLHTMHWNITISLKDAAIVTREDDGKIKVHETNEVTVAKGARRGAIVAGVFGLIFPPSLIVSVVAGGALGAAIGRLRDSGIKNDELKTFADMITPGKAAVVAAIDDESVLNAQKALHGADGELLVTLVDQETLDKIFLHGPE